MKILENLKFLWKMQKKYPEVDIRGSLFIDGKINHVSYAQAFHVYNPRTSEKTKHIRFKIWLLFSYKFRMTLLHELGQCLSKEGFSAHKMTSELSAWDWAFYQDDGALSCKEYGYYVYCLSTYVFQKHHTRYEKIYYKDTMLKLVDKHYQ